MGWQAPGLRALSEERLQTLVRAGSSWASYVRLVKHAMLRIFPEKKKGASLGRQLDLQIHVNENILRALPLKQNARKLRNTESAAMAARSYRLPPPCQQPLASPGPEAPQRGER